MKTWLRASLVALAWGTVACPAAWAQTAVGTAKPAAAAAVPAPAPTAASLGPTVQVGGQTLRLNGKGVRYRAMVKVYEIGLYAPTKVNSAEQFLSAPGAKRLQLITLRDLTGDVLGVAMVQGMQDNAPQSERVKLLGHMSLLSKVFGEEPKVPAGSVVVIDLVPGRGTILTLNGVQKADPITDPLFFAAAARIWLGPKPVDYLLKDALLGIEAKRPETG